LSPERTTYEELGGGNSEYTRIQIIVVGVMVASRRVPETQKIES
jgi:hypothetical protein